MAEPTTQDIAAYGAYLKSNGASDQDVHDYTKYLAEHHNVNHPSDNPSWLQSGISALGTAGKAIDSVTGAPTRAAIYAAQNGESPMMAAKNQFANMNQEAPSGEQIASKMGFSTESAGKPYIAPGPGNIPQSQMPTMNSPAKAVGIGVDLAANPLNFAGPVLKGVGKIAEFAAEPIAGALNEFAADRALKAAGAMKKDFNIIQSKGMHDALGNFLLDNKLVTPLSTVSKVADRITEAKQTAGETIGHILDTADASKAPPISARDIALHLSEDPEIMGLGNVPGQEKTSSQINNYINTLYNNGDNLTLREAQKLRQGIDSSINFNKRVPEMAGAQPYLFKMRDAISKAMNESVNSLPVGGELDRLKTANQSYSKLAQLDKIAQNRMGALSSNEQLNLSDKLAAGVGAVAGHGNPLAAVGLAGVSKAARSFGNSLAATGANAVSKVLESAPEALSGSENLIIPARATNTLNKIKESEINNKNNLPGYSEGGTVVQKPPTQIITNIDPQKAQSAQASLRKAFGLPGYAEGGTVKPPTTLPNIDQQKIQTAQASMRKAFGFAAGGIIPGTPQLPFNSPQNDNVLINATSGEVVLPLSVTRSSNPPQRAKEFMENEMGPDKWANDGLQNLRSHVGDEDREMIDENMGKMMLHPNMKNLLITASKFKPGSQPLDQIFKHLKGHLGMED